MSIWDKKSSPKVLSYFKLSDSLHNSAAQRSEPRIQGAADTYCESYWSICLRKTHRDLNLSQYLITLCVVEAISTTSTIPQLSYALLNVILKETFAALRAAKKMRVLRYVTQVPTYLGQHWALRCVTKSIYLPTYPENLQKVRYVICTWWWSLIWLKVRSKTWDQRHWICLLYTSDAADE